MDAPGQQPAAKGHRRGTHRLVPPAATVERLSSLKARMGITRVANVTGLDRIGIPVVMVCRPNSRSISVSQGKGLDLDAARASGLMESVESYHAERIELPLRLTSLESLQERHRVADVAALPAITSGRFRPALRTLWIEGRELISGATLWLPYETVHSDYTLPQPPGSGSFLASTNGLASGNHPLEAINHAICEVVERDATSIWNHLPLARRHATRLDLGTVDDSDCVQTIERLDGAGFEVAVWDVTSDVGIPSFYCLIIDRLRERAHSGAGAGTHSARGIALLRALTEAVQVRTTYIAGSRDDIDADSFTATALEQKLRRARALMARRAPGRDFRSIVTYDGSSFADDLTWLLARLRSAAIKQVIAVDLTRPDLAIPVVRVVIPGLEGPDDHPRYVPGPRARAAGERRV
jgi:YcaO-like protein with predicted kinase domain